LIKLTRKSYYLILIIIGLIAYFNSFYNSFVWDDEILIVGNEYIKSFKNIFKIFTVDIYHWITNSNFYRPLFYLYLMFVYHLWQLEPFGYHLTNLILHLLNAFLVFYLVNNLTSKINIAFLTTIFYLVHPVHTEAVTYISGRADLLAGFFVLGSVLFFVKSHQAQGRLKNVLYFATGIFFISGLLSKEIALVLPLILISYDYCFGYLFKNKKIHLIFLSLALIYITSRHTFFPFSSAGMLSDSLFVRLINLPKVIVFYLSLLIFPLSLRIERYFPLSRSFDLSIILCALLLIAILGWVFKNRHQRILLFSCLWFFINLLPLANIILPLNAEVAEHWVYLASIGFFIILVWYIDKILSKDFFVAGKKLSYQFKMVILVAILVSLGLLTIARNFEWSDPVVLFEATLKSSQGNINPRDIRVHFNLGNAYLKKGFVDKAITEFNEALKGLPFPRCKRAHYQLAIAYLYKSLYKEAEEQLLKAIEADPDYVSAYYLLGYLYKKTGKIDKAKEAWDKMREIKPTHPQEGILIEKVISSPSL